VSTRFLFTSRRPKARLSYCLRFFKTQGSDSSWNHLKGFAFPFPRYKTRLNCCLRLFKTQGSTSTWKRPKGFAFPFPSYKIYIHLDTYATKTVCGPDIQEAPMTKSCKDNIVDDQVAQKCVSPSPISHGTTVYLPDLIFTIYLHDIF
jgi:hypothetical protein